MINRFAEIILKYRWVTLFVTFIPIFLSLSGLEDFKTNYHMRYWLDKTDNLIEKLNYFEDNFGNDESAIFAIYNPKGVLNLETLSKIKKISAEIESVNDVKSTLSLVNLDIPYFDQKLNKLAAKSVIDFKQFDAKQIEKNIQSSSYIPKLFINDDHSIAIIFATLNPTIINNGEVFQEIHYRELTEAFRSIIKKYESNNFEVFLSGTPIIQNDFTEISEKDLALIMPLLFLIMAIILYVIFRSVWVMSAAFIVISLTNTFIYGIAGILGFEFENMLSIVPLIILTICLADIIHLYMTYQDERVQGSTQNDALKEAILHNFLPTFLTTATTAVGFASLASSNLIPVQNMGILSAIGIFFAWILSITLFPIFISFTKNENFQTSNIKHKLNFDIVIDFANSYKMKIITIFFILSILLAFIGIQNEVNTDPIKFFRKDTMIRKSSDFILEKFGAVSGPELIVHSGYREGILEPAFLKKVDEFGSWLKEKDYISKTISIVELGKELNKTLHNGDENFNRIPDTKKEIIDLYLENKDTVKNILNLSTRISTDMESIRLSLLWDITEMRARLDRLDLIKAKAKQMGLSVAVTGKNALYLEMNDYIVSTFFYSIGVAIIVISILMIFLFRSLKFGIIAMLPNLIPLCFITGIMTLFDIYIDMGTALVCSVCLGIAIDDTIHFMIQYKKERVITAKDIALKNVLNKTGKALFMTSFILVLGFSLFMMSDFIPNVKFGFLCSLTIAFALLTDFYLLPAVLLKLDKEGTDN